MRRQIFFCGLGGVSLYVGLRLFLSFLVGIRWSFYPPIQRVDTPERVVAITIDDGPSPATTPALLQVLSNYGVTATFFLIGRQVKFRESLARTIAQAGHALGNHSYSHSEKLVWSPREMETEIKETDDLIKKVGGRDPIFFRSPFFHNTVIQQWVLKGLKKKNVFGDVESHDWQLNEDKSAQRILEMTRPGSIIVIHSGVPYSPNILKKVLPALRQRGFRFVSLQELLSRS